VTSASPGGATSPRSGETAGRPPCSIRVGHRPASGAIPNPESKSDYWKLDDGQYRVDYDNTL
jgi:hypothetical protein